MDAGAALNVTPENFQTEVIERSQTVPIFVLFWADQIEPSVQTKAMLEQLIGQYQGKAVLALSDVAADQTLAQHLRVQGLPSIRVVHQGQIAELGFLVLGRSSIDGVGRTNIKLIRNLDVKTAA